MAEQQEGAVEGSQGEGNEPEPDWKSKYEEAIKHSREWERKAKANKGAADELEKLKASQMTDAEKAQKALEEAVKERDALRAEKERAAWVAEVSKDTGVPADLLGMIAADTKEDLAEKAEGLKGRYAQKQGSVVPVVLGDGTRAQPKAPKQTANEWLREQLRNR